ncbi:PPOX class F420-dependent oxidoreductase [Dictyobacter formicarum]|uniref:Pyridoxamine 5'-phosphate oxidase n=1 Tax=Dictyobacter formicarum TaxID=2778368 RepID=A0ABQ3VIV0_9CHLR|nr:PPOX class F420-dependent oxidoreductase [Dictyobacter formicarum]GHO86072.1 putative pyridoxamine 5'-phosphate oxidase [Dictyobacter formicarum]
MAVIPDKYKDILNTKAAAHVATIGPKGEPQSSPVWFGWDGTHLLFSQTKSRQKYRNLQRDSRIALSITDPKLLERYLEIRGHVVRIDEDPNLDFINSMAKKYLDLDKYPWHQPGDERVVIVVQPEHATYQG